MRKILTVCSRGNSRSVALAYLLKDGLDFDAIAIGVDSASNDTKDMLYRWADLIIVVHDELAPSIPQEFHDKMRIWNVGPDRYFRGFEQDLINQYRDYMRGEGWVLDRTDL